VCVMLEVKQRRSMEQEQEQAALSPRVSAPSTATDIMKRASIAMIVFMLKSLGLLLELQPCECEMRL
jgi:hypothetical protein